MIQVSEDAWADIQRRLAEGERMKAAIDRIGDALSMFPDRANAVGVMELVDRALGRLAEQTEAAGNG